MTFSVRSCLTTGVAAVTAVAIAAVPSVPTPTAHPAPAPTTHVRIIQQPVQLAAAVQPAAVTSTALPSLLTDWVHNIIPSSTAAFPTPQFPPKVAGNSISSGIKNVYNAVEPWVQWGFEVAAYAVGWIPWVGWLAPQIMIFYNLGERIVRSITFNIADWIGGSVSFVQGLRNVAVDTVNSFIQFANDELAFFLPPLPPIPPIGGAPASATAGPTAVKLATATATVPDGAAPAPAGEPAKTETIALEETSTPPATEPPAKDVTPAADTEKAPETPADQPEAQPETKPDVKTDVKADEVKADDQQADPTATEPDTTKPDTTKPDTPKAGSDTKADTPKPDTPKADSQKADDTKPAPKKTEPKKKKRDRASAGSSTPKTDTHVSSDAS